MAIVKELEKILEDSKYISFKSGELSKAADKYNDMVTRGIITPRGNCLMSPSQLYTQTITFNKNK